MVSRVRSKCLNETANFVLTCDPKGSPVRAVYAAESGKNASPFDATVRLLKGDDGSARLVDAKGNSQVVLPNDPLLDTEVVRHLFTAKEWNADNILHFSWENQRLLAISAFRQKESEPYYQRAISYAGTDISSEEYSSGGHTGRIKYQFAKNVLTSVKVEDGGVHDGKTWTARLQPRELAAR